MKKYVWVTFLVAGFAVSCTADNDINENIKSKNELSTSETDLMQREGDSIPDGETGGQGGGTHIKP